MMNVLITSMGSNTSIGIAKSLKSNTNINIIGIDTNTRDMCAGSTFSNLFIQVLPCNSNDYEKRLLEIINDNSVDCVIPVHDLEIEVISNLAEKYPDITKWAVNNPSLINKCNDKVQINTILSENGIIVPKFFTSSKTVSYPVIYKPIKGVSSKGIQMLKKMNDDFIFENGYFAQQFIEGKEYTVDCYTSYYTNQFKCSVRERIEVKEGMSTKGQIVLNKKIEHDCKKIHQILNYKGVSNIQFIIKNDIPYFIEINPRFAGGGILSYLMGLNLPEITVLELVENNSIILETSHPKIGAKMVRYWEETFYE